MIRALARESGSPVGAGEFVSPRPTRSAIGSDVQGAPAAGVETPIPAQPLLQPRRRHQPRRRPRQLLPLHPDRGVRRRGHRPEARRAPPAHRRALTRSGSTMSVSSSRSRRSTATPSTSRPRASALPTARRSSPTSSALSMDYYGAQDGAVAVEDIVACGPGATHPGPGRAPPAHLGHAFSVAKPRALGHLDDALRSAPDPVLRPGAGAVGDAPRQPHPARGSPRRPRPASRRSAVVRHRRRARGRPGRGRGARPDAERHHRARERDRAARGRARRRHRSRPRRWRLTRSSRPSRAARADDLEPRPEPVRLGARPARACDRDSRRRWPHEHRGHGRIRRH